MCKNVIYSLIASCVFATISFGISWDYQWNGNELPENYIEGGAFTLQEYEPAGSSILHATSDGIYTCETTNGTSANANANFYFKGSKIDLSSPMTLEFRLENESALSTYTTCLFIAQEDEGYCGFKFLSNNSADTYQNSARLTPYVDAEGYSIYRITTSVSGGDMTGADLYALKSDGTWSSSVTSAMITSSQTCDRISFGDIGSNWGGKWNVDYLSWTKQGATTAAIDDLEDFWQHQWQCNQNPEDYWDGDYFIYSPYEPAGSTITRSITNSVYTVETTNGTSQNANSSFKLADDKYDITKAMTIEFNLKNESALSYYTTCLFLRQSEVGYCGFKFVSDNKVNPYERSDLFTPYVDPNGWTTYRVLTTVDSGELVCAELYALNASDQWVGPVTSYLTSSAVASAQVSFGDIGSNWGGKWNVDGFSWTTKEATFSSLESPYKVWDISWNCVELPGDFMDGDVLSVSSYQPTGSTITNSVSNGVYSSETTTGDSANANSSISIATTEFDISKDMAIEFKLKNETALSYYTNCLYLKQSGYGYCGFKFVSDNKVNPYEYSDLLTPYVDASGWTTYKVLTNTDDGELLSAELYALNSNGSWSDSIISYVTTDTSTGDKILFGDIGSNWGGKWNLDSLYWVSGYGPFDLLYDASDTPDHSWTWLEDGRVEVVGDIEAIITDSDEHIEFPWMKRFGDLNDEDAVVWLSVHRGVHTVSEWSDYLWSDDDAQTWSEPNITIVPINCMELDDGSVMAVSCWDTTASISHTVTVRTWPDPLSSEPTSSSCVVTLPFSSTFCLHRSLIAYDSNDSDKLMFTAYGRKTGDPKDRTMCVTSTDGGQNWSYKATIAYDASFSSEGYNEPTLVRLANNSVLCLMRTGVNYPCRQSISTNGGTSWSTPVNLSSSQSGLDPEVVLLSNGALLASAGSRPGIDLFVDFSGTGNNWQEVDWPLFQGSGFECGYTAMAEVEPGLVMFVSTESAFLTDSGFPGPHKLFKTYIRVTPED